MRPALILFFLLFPAFLPMNPAKNSASNSAWAETPAPIADQGDYVLSYGLYAGGLRALDVSLEFRKSDTTYGLNMAAKPYGLIGTLLPWAGTHQVAGNLEGERMIPSRYTKISQWRDDKDQDFFTYDKQGVLTKLRRIDGDKKPVRERIVDLDPALHHDTIDLLTATLLPLRQINRHQPCDISVDVFDGKRRYALKFTDKGDEKLTRSKYNIFEGTAHICQVEMIPQAGFKKKLRGYYKIQEEGRKQGQLPKIWLGRLTKDMPYLPVKIMLKSEHGAVLIHVQNHQRK